MSIKRIIKFPFLNDDWKTLNAQENGNNTPSSSFSLSTRFKLKLPASYDQWMEMETFENGLQIVLKVDQFSAKGNALDDIDSHWGAVIEKYLFASEDSYLPDITLEVGTEKTPFRAHRFILALGCDVFKAMFYGSLKEKGEKVHIKEMQPEVFKILLRYLYGSIITLKNEDEALNAWMAADRYCVQQMKDECHDFFGYCILTARNVWKLYEAAKYFDLESLASRCKKFIHKDMEVSVWGGGFLEANIKTIEEIFKRPNARVSELFLMESLVYWGRNQVEIGEARSLRDALQTVLPNFRFGALTPPEFCKFVDDNADLLDQSDAFKILKYLIDPITNRLPGWCCGLSWPRHLDLTSRSYKQYEGIYKHFGKKGKASKKLKAQHNPFFHC